MDGQWGQENCHFSSENLGDIVTSPRNQKDGTHLKWFQFAAVNED